MPISKLQPMRPALDAAIDMLNDIDITGLEGYVEESVDNWLDEHPEATTTVQDNSLDTPKYKNRSVTGEKIALGTVTPENLASRDLLFVGGAASVTYDEPIEDTYLYHATPDEPIVGSGLACIDNIKGNSLRWNQLCNFAIVSNRVAGSSYTNASYNSDTNTLTAEATEAVTNAYLGYTVPVEQIAIGHKYLFVYHVATGAANAVAKTGIYRAVGANTQAVVSLPAANAVYAVSQIMQLTEITSGATSVLFRVFLLKESNPDTALPTGTTVKLSNPMLFDLTQMFGSGNEPATVEEFEALYPDAYYPYDAGSLLDVQMTGIESTAADESWSSSLALPATDLRSAGTARDELREDERITRVGVVDLGTLEWGKTEDSRLDVGYYFNTAEIAAVQYGTANRSCAKYPTLPQVGLTNIISANGSAIDKVTFAAANAKLYVIDSTYTDAVAFKAAMSGVMLNYELATPTITPIDPPLCMSYRTEKGGTERVTTPTSTMSAPPTILTRYPVDLARGMLTVDSLDNLLDALGQALGSTITKSWDGSAYEFAVTSGRQQVVIHGLEPTIIDIPIVERPIIDTPTSERQEVDVEPEQELDDTGIVEDESEQEDM